MNALNAYYSRDTVSRLQQKNRASLVRLLIWAALILCICVLLCLGLDPLNSRRRLILTVAVFTVGGWIALYVLRYGLLRRRSERRHVEWVLAQEKEQIMGRLHLTDDVLRLRNSIPVRTVILEQEGQTRRLKLQDGLSTALRELEGQPIRLSLAGSYIVGAEVCP